MPSLYIVLEKKLSGFDDYVNGHALYDALRDLNPLANQLGIKSLMDFYGQVPKPIPPTSEADETAEEESLEGPTNDERPPESEDETGTDDSKASGEAEEPAPAPPQEKWFPIAEGLRTVNGYLNYLKKSAYAVPNTPLIKKELLEWQRVLYLASQELKFWHLAIS